MSPWHAPCSSRLGVPSTRSVVMRVPRTVCWSLGLAACFAAQVCLAQSAQPTPQDIARYNDWVLQQYLSHGAEATTIPAPGQLGADYYRNGSQETTIPG